MNNKSKSKSESIQEILDVLCKEKVARCYSINSNCDFFTSEKKNDKETAWLFNILSDRLSIPNGEVIEMSDTNITIWSSKSFNSILRVLLNKKRANISYKHITRRAYRGKDIKVVRV